MHMKNLIKMMILILGITIFNSCENDIENIEPMTETPISPPTEPEILIDTTNSTNIIIPTEPEIPFIHNIKPCIVNMLDSLNIDFKSKFQYVVNNNYNNDSILISQDFFGLDSPYRYDVIEYYNNGNVKYINFIYKIKGWNDGECKCYFNESNTELFIVKIKTTGITNVINVKINNCDFYKNYDLYFHIEMSFHFHDIETLFNDDEYTSEYSKRNLLFFCDTPEGIITYNIIDDYQSVYANNMEVFKEKYNKEVIIRDEIFYTDYNKLK